MQGGSDTRLLPDFGLSQANITVIAQGGWTLADVRTACPQIAASAPDFLIIQVGSNDLGSVLLVDSIKVANNLLELANYLCTVSGARGALICHLTQRGQSRRLPTHSNVALYNDKILMANLFIKEVLGAGLEPQLISWPHKGMILSMAHLLCNDGTHVNHNGQLMLYRSIRGAVIYACKIVGVPAP